MAERAPDPGAVPLLEALLELARSAERNAIERRAGRRLTVVDGGKRKGASA
jgi:hypothetical protein